MIDERMNDAEFEYQWQNLIQHCFSRDDIQTVLKLKRDHFRARDSEKALEEGLKSVSEYVKRLEHKAHKIPNP